MADKSAIEWTDATWNPIVGCSIVSPGCTNCYAMGMAGRIEAMTAALRKEGKTGAPHYDGTTKKVNGNTVWTGKLALAPEAILLEPLAWKRPRKIFVNSMGDLFHEDVPDEWIDRVFAVMALCADPHSPLRGSSPLAPQHTFQVLTKRARRMREYFAFAGSQQLDRGGGQDKACARDRIIIEALRIANNREAPNEAADWVLGAFEQWPLPNVLLGVSAERQQEADERIPELLATTAAIRFVSAEPLLGPIDFARIKQSLGGESYVGFNALRSGGFDQWSDARIDWIIVGGESGPNARPMHPDWVRQIQRDTFGWRVPFFFKQWGEWVSVSCQEGRPVAWHEFDDGACVKRLAGGKKAAGRLLDGVEHNAFPELREVPAL
jgi:protein gp37